MLRALGHPAASPGVLANAAARSRALIRFDDLVHEGHRSSASDAFTWRLDMSHISYSRRESAPAQATRFYSGAGVLDR
jgi:hypothetical protein